MTTRPAFDHDLELLYQQYTIIYYKAQTASTYIILNQGKKLDPSSKVGSTTNKRVGDTNAWTSRGAAEHSAGVSVYFEDDIKEIAGLLGYTIPSTGWAGTEEIKLDGTKKVDIKAVTFASTDSGAAELFTEYLLGFGCTEIKTTLDADNDNARVAELSGVADEYYFTAV